MRKASFSGFRSHGWLLMLLGGTIAGMIQRAMGLAIKVTPEQARVLVACCAMVVLLLVGGGVVLWLRKRFHASGLSQEMVLTLEQIDSLLEAGEITPQEHAVLRNQHLVPILQAKEAGGAGDACGSDDAGEKDSQSADGPATMRKSLGADGLPYGNPSDETGV